MRKIDQVTLTVSAELHFCQCAVQEDSFFSCLFSSTTKPFWPLFPSGSYIYELHAVNKGGVDGTIPHRMA